MEKKINKFKDTAMVVIKDRKEELTLVEKLISPDPNNVFTSLPPEYCIYYDLYVNGRKVIGDFINPYGERILYADTFKEITEEDIKNFLDN